MPVKVIVRKADHIPTKCPYCGAKAYYVYIYIRKGDKLIPKMVNCPTIYCPKCGFVIK